MKQIRVLVPDVPDCKAIAPYLENMDAAKWYTNFAPNVIELERRIEELYPDMHAVTVSSATTGLEIAIRSLGIAHGRKVLVPSLSFPATASVAVNCGLEPVYADVDADSWMLTPEIAYASLKHADFSLVIPVCAYGAEHDLKGWEEFTRTTKIKVLIDAAAAFGNDLCSRDVMSVISLHATKTMPAGEGGVVLVPDGFRATSIRRLSNFGIDPTSGDMLAMTTGTNAKMSEYHAAVALAALDNWPLAESKRVAMHKKYLQTLTKSCPSVKTQMRRDDGIYNTLVILLPKHTNPTYVATSLKSNGIETRKWYCPPQHEHPGLRYPSAGPLVVTDDISRRLLGLPFHLELTNQDIEMICQTLSEAIA